MTNYKIKSALGMPTDVDVRLLSDKFGVPAVGSLVEYAQIEEVLKIRRGSSRFQTVTRAWRDKLERDHNLLTKAVPNKGFRIADPSERADMIGRKFKSHLRGIKKSGARAVLTPREGLSSDAVRTMDHVGNTAATLVLHAQLAARKLKREMPPEIDAAKKLPAPSKIQPAA